MKELIQTILAGRSADAQEMVTNEMSKRAASFVQDYRSAALKSIFEAEKEEDDSDEDDDDDEDKEKDDDKKSTDEKPKSPEKDEDEEKGEK